MYPLTTLLELLRLHSRQAIPDSPEIRVFVGRKYAGRSLIYETGTIHCRKFFIILVLIVISVMLIVPGPVPADHLLSQNVESQRSKGPEKDRVRSPFERTRKLSFS